MRIGVTSDLQLGTSPGLADDRLGDQEGVLNQIADLFHERGVDVVLVVGDCFENRHPSEEARLVFKRWLARLDGLRCVIVAGNHDLRNASLASAVDLYDRCEFVRIPTVLDLGGCSLACLPWAPIHNLVAAREQGRTGAFEQAGEALVAIARDLRSQCPAGKPALLAAHWAISGASLPSGLPVADLAEVILPDYPLIMMRWEFVAAGHIHSTGYFNPNMFYAGSPYPCGFGETGQPHGAWIVDTDSSGLGLTEATFVEVPSRPLVTIDVDFTDPETFQWQEDAYDSLILDETLAISDAINAAPDLTDATVRVRYRATEEQHQRVQQQVVKQAILDAGAHRVHSITPEIVRSNRARAAGVDESLEPQQALAAWCEANDLTAHQTDGLFALLERFSA